jgi:hypothetical protein
MYTYTRNSYFIKNYKIKHLFIHLFADTFFSLFLIFLILTFFIFILNYILTKIIFYIYHHIDIFILLTTNTHILHLCLRPKGGQGSPRGCRPPRVHFIITLNSYYYNKNLIILYYSSFFFNYIKFLYTFIFNSWS